MITVPDPTEPKHRKLTVADAELRDLFACFLVTGIAMARVAQKPDAPLTTSEWEVIARSAYDGAGACIHRRKQNKDAIRARRDSEEDNRGNR